MLLGGLALLAYTAYQATICARHRACESWRRCLLHPSRPQRTATSPPAAAAAACCSPPFGLPQRPPCSAPPPPAADRETLRLTQQEFEGLPLPLLAQLVAAVAACLLGSLAAWGSFQPIRIADVPRQAFHAPAEHAIGQPALCLLIGSLTQLQTRRRLQPPGPA